MQAAADFNNAIEIAKFIWMVVVSLGTAGAWIYTWLSQRRSATLDAVSSMESHVNALTGRIASLEKDMEYSPNRTEMNTLHDRITELGNDVNRLTGGVEQLVKTNEGVSEQLKLINKYLLEHK